MLCMFMRIKPKFRVIANKNTDIKQNLYKIKKNSRFKMNSYDDHFCYFCLFFLYLYFFSFWSIF